LPFTTSRAFRAGVLSLALGLSASAAQAGVGGGSSAYGLSVDFTVAGTNTGIGAVNRLSSSAAGKTANSGAYSKVLTIATGVAPPAVTVKAANFNSHVGTVVAKDGTSIAGDATATGFSLTLAPPTGVAGVSSPPFLKITATKLRETGTYLHGANKNPAISGVAAISGLTVTGTLVGGKTLTFSGTPKNNQILFQSGTVTITLNFMTSTDLISCGPKCVVTPFSVRTAALQVSLDKAPIGERKLTGEIDVGGANAGIEGGF
jgi:hypothetical protein